MKGRGRGGGRASQTRQHLRNREEDMRELYDSKNHLLERADLDVGLYPPLSDKAQEELKRKVFKFRRTDSLLLQSIERGTKNDSLRLERKRGIPTLSEFKNVLIKEQKRSLPISIFIHDLKRRNKAKKFSMSSSPVSANHVAINTAVVYAELEKQHKQNKDGKKGDKDGVNDDLDKDSNDERSDDGAEDNLDDGSDIDDYQENYSLDSDDNEGDSDRDVEPMM